MRIFCLAASAGIFVSSFFPALPSPWFLLTIALFLSGLFFCRSIPGVSAISGLSLGILWGVAAGHWILSGIPPEEWERKNMQASGCISGLPTHYVEGDPARKRTRFEFLVRRLYPSAQPETLLPIRRVRLSWYSPPPLQVGQCWELQIRLRAPQGFANPGSGDYGAWLLSQGIGASGYVRSPETARRLPIRDWRTAHHRLRSVLATRLSQRPQKKPSPFLNALSLGDRRTLPEDLRRMLQRSGTAHLLAISGLHIACIALLSQLLFRFLAHLFPSALQILPASCWGALGAILGAFFYALLAGFSLPTRRAFIMVSLLMAGQLLRRRISFGSGFCLALLLILLREPLAAHTAGFWLSFVAVAALLYVFDRRTPMTSQTTVVQLALRRLRSFTLAQCAVSLSLLLPLGVFLHEAPLLSMPANFFAIPWVSLVVVPAALAGTLLSGFSVGEMLLRAAEWSLSILFLVLDLLLNSLALPVWHPAGWPLPVLAIAALGILLLLRSRRPLYLCAGAMLLLPLLWNYERPRPGELQMSVLDVGQGLSVLLRTRNHSLLYDTGPALGSTDAGRLAVVPVLRHMGVRSLDRLILSHGDLDHVGGTASVLEAVPVHRIFHGEHDSVGRNLHYGIKQRVHDFEPCQRDQSWRWDGVDFRILHPPANLFVRNANDRSCVLLLEVGGHRILLPGDISGRVERHLLTDWQHGLVTVLLASHHGSSSSSVHEWIQTLRPEYVIYSSDRISRFAHPHPDVVARFRESGAVGIHTGRSGAVRFVFSAQGRMRGPQIYRDRHRRYWHRR